MVKIIINLLLLVLLARLAAARPQQDLVHLPVANYSHPWYSGYLNISTGDYHYVFFDSQRDPDNDPLVLWLNGGPGCSSMIGMVLENGPFILQPNKLIFKLNDNAWNKKANVLYLQSPGGVGFSKSKTNNTYSDRSITQDNYEALAKFFSIFTQLKNNDFYMAGESYAGIYIPYLATKINEMNDLPSTMNRIPLKGIMIGNGCTDPRQCYEPDMGGEDSKSIYQYQFLYNHNYITDQDYLMFTGACILGYHSQVCEERRKIIDGKFASTMTSINNIYKPCTHQEIPYLPKVLQGRRKSSRAYTTCDDLLGIYHFFNQPEMFLHLHVDPIKWDICNDDVADKYIENENASLPLYPGLIKSGIRIWIYSGDVDANVPIVGTLRWLHLFKDLQGLFVLEPWREWWVPGLHKHEDQMGGNVWKLKGLTFVQVRGAGHMVPADKPLSAQVLFESFISGADLPYKTE